MREIVLLKNDFYHWYDEKPVVSQPNLIIIRDKGYIPNWQYFLSLYRGKFDCPHMTGIAVLYPNDFPPNSTVDLYDFMGEYPGFTLTHW